MSAPTPIEESPAPEISKGSQPPVDNGAATTPVPPKASQQQETSSPPPPPPPSKTVAEDERFVKYFKMLKMGVPLQAVKNKMKAEGLDDSVLDNPDAPADYNDVPNDSDEDSAGDESDSWD